MFAVIADVCACAGGVSSFIPSSVSFSGTERMHGMDGDDSSSSAPETVKTSVMAIYVLFLFASCMDERCSSITSLGTSNAIDNLVWCYIHLS